MLTENNLLQLIDSGGARNGQENTGGSIAHTASRLGISAFLSDVLIRHGRSWPELLLQQLKTIAERLAGLTSRKMVISGTGALC